MDQTTTLLMAMLMAAGLGLFATWAIVRRERRQSMPPVESPFAASTEGEKRCPKCGMGNMWTDARCVSCGGPLKG
jgi:hypothetical protein